ncbi:MAG: hypothetical protein ACXVRJ_04735 [Gaiellaceae bacterium]
MADRRWDGDERGDGIADAGPFVDGVVELIEAMRRPNWVSEEPELHLLPHLRHACQSLPLRIVAAQAATDGSYEVRLEWIGSEPGIGVVREAVFSLIGSVSELSSYVRQRSSKPTAASSGTLLFDVVTGMVDGETRFAPHGHTLRISVAGVS